MKMLTAIDLSDSTPKLLEEAKKLAHSLSAKLWIVYVADPDPDFVGFEPDPEVMRDIIAKKYHGEHLQLQAIGEELRHDGIDCVALLIQGPIVQTLLHESERLSVDMIVIGSHGKSALKQFLIGSTSEGILHKSNVPVYVVPTRGILA